MKIEDYMFDNPPFKKVYPQDILTHQQGQDIEDLGYCRVLNIRLSRGLI